MSPRPIFLGLTLLGPGIAQAAEAPAGSMASCALIADADLRLACFDAAIRGQPAAPPSSPAVPAPPPVRSVPPPAAVSAKPLAELPAPAAAVPASEFGAEMLRGRSKAGPAAAEVMSGRVEGRFEGWEKGTRFSFENGQIWESVGDMSVYHLAESPVVQIRRGFLGSYWLSVPGLNSEARVRRIK